MKTWQRLSGPYASFPLVAGEAIEEKQCACMCTRPSAYVMWKRRKNACQIQSYSSPMKLTVSGLLATVTVVEMRIKLGLARSKCILYASVTTIVLISLTG